MRLWQAAAGQWGLTGRQAGWRGALASKLQPSALRWGWRSWSHLPIIAVVTPFCKGLGNHAVQYCLFASV